MVPGVLIHPRFRLQYYLVPFLAFFQGPLERREHRECSPSWRLYWGRVDTRGKIGKRYGTWVSVQEGRLRRFELSRGNPVSGFVG
jgi:hypothetical protein